MFGYNVLVSLWWEVGGDPAGPSTLRRVNSCCTVSCPRLLQLIGLAIYNSVILDLHFPLIVYQKLVGIKPSLRWVPRLHSGVWSR